jgi:hypothetical protein
MADDDLATDLLDGIPAIAAFLGLPVRRTYELAEKRRLPLFGVESGRGANRGLGSTFRAWTPLPPATAERREMGAEGRRELSWREFSRAEFTVGADWTDTMNGTNAAD